MSAALVVAGIKLGGGGGSEEIQVAGDSQLL
jgi:hypothetical protein